VTSESENPHSTTQPPMAAPTAAVLLIGNELLSGRTQDTNLAYMAQALAAHGIKMTEARIVPDIHTVIVDTVNVLREINTYVFTTGGIGPTHDDITADCIAEAFGVSIDIHPEAERRLMSYWTVRDLEPNEDRMRMARIPQGAHLIDNPVSVAPGFRIDNVFVMAGVPRIMQAMFDSILPSLEKGAVIDSVSVSCNLGEGTIAGPLRALQERFPDVDLGSYPRRVDGAFQVMLVARGVDAEQLQQVGLELQALVLGAGGELIDQ